MSDGGFLIKDSRLAAVRVVGRVGLNAPPGGRPWRFGGFA